MKIINNGVATGYIFNFTKTKCIYEEKTKNTLEEKNLFIKAINSYLGKLNQLKEKTTGTVKDIIETYKAFLKDSSVKRQVFNRIDKFKESAGCAYTKVMDSYINKLKQVDNNYLKERANDFEDLKEKVLKEMYEEAKYFKMTRPTILIVEQLQTSLVLNLCENIVGIVAFKGGDLSHASILVKEKNIPFIIVDDLKLKDGTIVTIDTFKKSIKEKERFQEVKERQVSNETLKTLIETSSSKAKLYLNLSTLEELNNNKNKLYDGAGLVRTELLFSNISGYPNLETQIKYYKEILAYFYPKLVKIRLFDIKEDKGFSYFISKENNNFKFNGPLKKIYKEQLKALIIANEPYGNLNITIPMINKISEYNYVEDELKRYKKDLLLIRDIPKVGIMLETKEALNNISQFKEVKYISVGTNDLTRELYGVNREKLENSDKYTKKLIKALETAKNFSIENEISYFYCGDLVSTRNGLIKLLNRGEKNFSIADGFLEEAVNIINNFN